MMNNHPAIVMGNLMMGRCFTLAKIPYIGVTTNNDKRLFYSRSCQKGYMLPHPAKDQKAAFDGLMRIADTHGDGLPLFYTNDAQLKMIIDNAGIIKERFKILLPEDRLLASSMDKNLFTKLVKEFDLPVPPTFHMDEINKAEDLDYPVIIKPTSRVHWFKSKLISEIGAQQKIVLVKNETEFKHFQEKLFDEKIEYIVQKYIYGTEANILSFHSFYDQNSNPLGHYCGRKIRTYPYDYGLSCYLKLIKNEDVTNTSLDILKRLKFKGPIKIDYKLDEKSGKIYLLELNTRYNMWHYIGARAGINLPAIAYKYLETGNAVKIPTNYRTDLKWLSAFQDILTFRDMKKRQLISTAAWLSSLRGKKIYQTYAPDDLRPVLYAVMQTIKGVFRRLRKLF